MQSSVKILRSYDYCHFEVSLTSECADLDAVNDLRKQAAILVDEAVRQYKIAKAAESKREWAERQTREALVEMDAIKAKPRNAWSVREAAVMRSYEDQSFWKAYNDEAYFYEQDERDHHFSMLNRFKDVTIRATEAALLDYIAASEPRFSDEPSEDGMPDDLRAATQKPHDDQDFPL